MTNIFRVLLVLCCLFKSAQEYLWSADEKMQSKSIYARVNAILVVEAGGLRKL